MELKEALLAGRKILEDNEWCRNRSHYKEDGKSFFCALGAAQEGVWPGFWTEKNGLGSLTDDELNLFTLVYRALLKALDGKEWGGVILYNDKRAKNKEDILRIFDEAISRA